MDENFSEPEQAVLAMLFEAGQRPSLADVRRASEASGAFAISHDPGSETGSGGESRSHGENGPGYEKSHDNEKEGSGDDAGWAELLITGLTFDIAGLSPGERETMPPIAHRFGLAWDWRSEALEAVLVRPGAHLAGAAAMLPVVRACVALGAALADHTAATAVVWIPAGSAMAPDYFAATIADWQRGGAFPALGLTALVAGASGVTSDGLTFFTGQEIEVCGSDLAAAGRIAVRMIHTLVGHGPLSAPTQLTGPDGESLLAELSGDGRRVRLTFAP